MGRPTAGAPGLDVEHGVDVDLDRQLPCDSCSTGATTRLRGRCAGGHRLRREVCAGHALVLWRDWRDPGVTLVCTLCPRRIVDVRAEEL